MSRPLAGRAAAASRADPRPAEPLEGLEQAADVPGRDDRPGVADREDRPPVRDAGADLHPATADVVAQGVVGAVTFAAGLAAAAVVVTLGQRILRGNGVYVYPVSGLTPVRVVAGMAALLAIAAILALAIGTLLRRSAGSVATVTVVIVLPYLLTVTAPVLPAGLADWVLRITPAAAISVQQVMPQYAQVSNVYTPAQGFFPLAPWAGLAVLCAWAALALGLAVLRLRRADA
jgi:ABC-type transport system involved in multi-copper enzyme maturation permease subunit